MFVQTLCVFHSTLITLISNSTHSPSSYRSNNNNDVDDIEATNFNKENEYVNA